MVEQQLAEWLEEGYVASFRTACLILGNRADAEEAVQDAYLRAWRFRDSLSAVQSIRPWLARVVVNSCYSKLRREIPHRDRRAGDEPLTHVAASDADAEEAAERGETAETVLRALQQLPMSLRVPVVLRYYADLSERDIALAIGRRPGTVKSRLHEARRRLAADPALCALTGSGESPRAEQTVRTPSSLETAP
jgi:RNA polymerase sigma-70 factor, ECF subfamily